MELADIFLGKHKSLCIAMALVFEVNSSAGVKTRTEDFTGDLKVYSDGETSGIKSAMGKIVDLLAKHEEERIHLVCELSVVVLFDAV